MLCVYTRYRLAINTGKRFKNRTMPVISAGLPSAIYLTVVVSHLPRSSALFSLQNSATLFPLLQGKASGITFLLPTPYAFTYNKIIEEGNGNTLSPYILVRYIKQEVQELLST